MIGDALLHRFQQKPNPIAVDVDVIPEFSAEPLKVM